MALSCCRADGRKPAGTPLSGASPVIGSVASPRYGDSRPMFPNALHASSTLCGIEGGTWAEFKQVRHGDSDPGETLSTATDRTSGGEKKSLIMVIVLSVVIVAALVTFLPPLLLPRV